MVPRVSARFSRTLAVLALALGSSCASVQFDPETATSGRFRSSAVSFTFLGRDFPQSAILLARANAADSQLTDLVVEQEQIFPYLWKLDFLLDVISFRYAMVSGTWGSPDG